MRLNYITVFAISHCTILLELSFTKILAFVFWNHIVYLIVSIALLGYGIGSNAVMLSTRLKIPSYSVRVIPLLLLGFSASIVVSLAFLAFFTNSYGHIADTPLMLVPAYGIFTFPFMFGGALLVVIFQEYHQDSSRLYFWDMMGASLGAIIFSPLLYSFSMKGLIIFAITCPLLIAALMLNKQKEHSLISYQSIPLLVLIAISLFGISQSEYILNLKPSGSKSLARALDVQRNPTAFQEATVWDPVTRIDVRLVPEPVHAFNTAL